MFGLEEKGIQHWLSASQLKWRIRNPLHRSSQYFNSDYQVSTNIIKSVIILEARAIERLQTRIYILGICMSAFVAEEAIRLSKSHHGIPKNLEKKGLRHLNLVGPIKRNSIYFFQPVWSAISICFILLKRRGDRQMLPHIPDEVVLLTATGKSSYDSPTGATHFLLKDPQRKARYWINSQEPGANVPPHLLSHVQNISRSLLPHFWTELSTHTCVARTLHS